MLQLLTRLAALLLALSLLGGCSAVGSALEAGRPLVFGGLRNDLRELNRALDLTPPGPGEPACGGMGPMLAPFLVVDLPCSLAVDLALLPVSVLLEVVRPDDEARDLAGLRRAPRR